MSDRLTDEEIEEIRGREKKAPGEKWEARCEYDDEWMVGEEDKLGWGVYFFGQTEDFAQFVAHARTDIPRLLNEVERLRNRVAQMEFKSTTYTEEVEDELTRLTDQAQRDAGKIEMLTDEVDRLRTGTSVQRCLHDMYDDELIEDRSRFEELKEVYSISKIEHAIDLAVAAIDDELRRRKVGATNE